MVEKLVASSRETLELLKLATDMHAFQGRLEDYTESKCTYTRQMDTCILEMLYWTNSTRQIMGETRQCFEDCDTDSSCKKVCVADARKRYEKMQGLTEEMIQVNKNELLNPQSNPGASSTLL